MMARLKARFGRGRMVECAACGKPLPVRRAVIIHGEITRDRDAYATTVAEYHRRCAPT